jgi:hypothetical protein
LRQQATSLVQSLRIAFRTQLGSLPARVRQMTLSGIFLRFQQSDRFLKSVILSLLCVVHHRICQFRARWQCCFRHVRASTCRS